MNKKTIYLDYNATTPVWPEVREAMLPFLEGIFGNASSVHSVGQKAKNALEQSREKIAGLLHARDAQEIVFTSGGTESDVMAIQGAAFALRKKGSHIITSSVEHHAVYNTCQYLEKYHGFSITYLPVNKDGRVNPEDLKKSITDATILVSIMMANNEVGSIQPIAELAGICRDKKILFHTDAVQAGGKLQIDLQTLQVDMLSLSAHKLYGPKGTGMLFLKKGTVLHPLLHGGHHEKNRRAGTENIAGIVGMAKAVELAFMDIEKENMRLKKLTKKLEEQLCKKIPYTRINGSVKQRLPNTLNMSFEFIEGEGIILSCDMQGIAVSTGSACASGSLEPSHVLTAMGVPVEIAHGSVRFSLGKDTTEADITYVIEVFPKIIERLRSMSPLWEDKLKGVKTVFSEDRHHDHEQ